MTSFSTVQCVPPGGTSTGFLVGSVASTAISCSDLALGSQCFPCPVRGKAGTLGRSYTPEAWLWGLMHLWPSANELHPLGGEGEYQGPCLEEPCYPPMWGLCAWALEPSPSCSQRSWVSYPTEKRQGCEWCVMLTDAEHGRATEGSRMF